MHPVEPTRPKSMMGAIFEHVTIITSLMLREVITRYGRRGLGFFWLVGEPLLFTGAVIILWSFIKAPYQHGLRIAPFVMTGYMTLIMFRHLISYALGAVSGNLGLLFHQKIKILHVYLARFLLELGGATLAFVIVYAVLMAFGQVGWPADLLLVYGGWLTLFVLGMGIALVVSALAMEFEVVERIVPVLMYIVLPFSGAFTMAAWLPPKYREVYLAIPIPHPVEMIRAGVFGEFVETHYDPFYPLFWGGVLIVLGLVMISRAKEHIDAD